MKLCIRCNGTKRYLGNGMIMTDCDLCDDSSLGETVVAPPIDKRSSTYRAAIKDIMAINPKISKTEAEKIFDKEYHKA